MVEMLGWQLSPAATGSDGDVVDAVEVRFRQIHEANFAGTMDCNEALPVQVRALRRIDDWWVFLLLTPWMFSRLFLPRQQPRLPLPTAWTAEGRRKQAYVVIGPPLELALQSGVQRAHINYDAVLGHYLIQPLVQAMEGYDSPDQVFSAWNEVIATRDRVMIEQQRDCPWQKEVSRREWFARVLGRER
jgi:[NiFe]-hydrogenase assembly, chaperone, HybE